jgi:endonuclease/exonuclease/phosphatase (EEP) superfamily protein YafD
MIGWYRSLIGLGVALGLVLTGLGWLAEWWPALDLVNNGIPALFAGSVVLFMLALVTWDWRLIALAALLTAVNAGSILEAMQGAASEAESGDKRFLRLVTFNVGFDNDRIDSVHKFLIETHADIVVLQECTLEHMRRLHKGLDARYPYRVGEISIAIFSRYPIKTDGRIDRIGYPDPILFLARWVEVDVNGKPIEVVGTHLVRPFHPALQKHDLTALSHFVRNRELPIIVAGDFNLTPWTYQLNRFVRSTKLGRFNTFHHTWPMPVPFVAISNVFASREFVKIATFRGPSLGSDHWPIIVDIALSRH